MVAREGVRVVGDAVDTKDYQRFPVRESTRGNSRAWCVLEYLQRIPRKASSSTLFSRPRISFLSRTLPPKLSWQTAREYGAVIEHVLASITAEEQVMGWAS